MDSAAKVQKFMKNLDPAQETAENYCKSQRLQNDVRAVIRIRSSSSSSRGTRLGPMRRWPANRTATE